MTTRLSTLMLTLLVGAALALGGCEKSAREETHIFQEAEALYRAGDYDGASQRYQSFLETYPRSPFARTAKLRMRTIDREIESVMGTRGTNRPIFIRPTASETSEIVAEVDRRDEAAHDDPSPAAADGAQPTDPEAPGDPDPDEAPTDEIEVEALEEPTAPEVEAEVEDGEADDSPPQPD